MIREQMKKNIDVIINSLKYILFNSVLKRLLIAMIPFIGLLANDYSVDPDGYGTISVLSTFIGIAIIIAIIMAIIVI